MARKMNAETTRRLNELHSCYCNYNQEPGKCNLLMVEKGHPHADDYKDLRAAFDQLRYACNSESRLIAYRDEDEKAEMMAPSLGIEFRDMGPKFTEFFNAYPGTDYARYLEYIDAAAASGWHEDCKPSIETGGFRIRTRNVELAADVYRIMGGTVDIPAMKERAIYIVIYGWRMDGGQALRILAAIRRRMRACLLPLRSTADDVFDLAPLDLANKRFTFAGGDRVQVTDHAVMVPLIPLGGQGQQIVEQAMADLLNLCEQGYPWQGSVRDWMTKFIKPASLGKIDRRFAAKAAI